MIKKLKINDFLKQIPYDNIGHCNCNVTYNDDANYFAYVRLDGGILLRTYSFKDFWVIMKKLDDESKKLNIRCTVKTPLFRKSILDDFTTFNIGM